jgi:hypothetical protein
MSSWLVWRSVSLVMSSAHCVIFDNFSNLAVVSSVSRTSTMTLFTSVSAWVVLQLGGQALNMVRPWGPMLTLEQWDDLKKTGFASVDTHTIIYSQAQPMCVWVFMARDDLVDLLRERLTVLQDLQLKQQQSLVIVGVKAMATLDLLQKTRLFSLCSVVRSVIYRQSGH